MDTQTFAEEAKRLSRPCHLLRDGGGGDPSAFWHGTEPGLCVSLSHNAKWLNVFLHDDYKSGHADLSGSPIESETPLFGTQEESLPPVDAVFLNGSNAIAEFLATHDWPRNEPFNCNFPDPAPSEYERQWQSNCPLYHSDISLMVGGWHMPWPDGDWYDFVDAELVAWTFRNSEPWIEVFLRDGAYVVKQRIT